MPDDRIRELRQGVVDGFASNGGDGAIVHQLIGAGGVLVGAAAMLRDEQMRVLALEAVAAAFNMADDARQTEDGGDALDLARNLRLLVDAKRKVERAFPPAGLEFGSSD